MANDEEVLAVIKKFVTNLGLDPVACNSATELRALGIDSLQAVDLIFQFEEHFGVQIPMEQFNATTVGEVLAFVSELLQPTTTS